MNNVAHLPQSDQVPPIQSLADDDGYSEFLTRFAGREHIGIPQRTLPKLDALTMGLRGLILLAGAPNCGKTAFSLQLALDTVRENDDTAFLFLSLEMNRHAMRARIESRLSGIPWRDLVRKTYDEAAGTRLDQARCDIRSFGERVRILDSQNFKNCSLETVVDQINDLKQLPGIERVTVLVDYLQVWPVQDDKARTLRTDVDSDKWRIAQMLELRDANNGDPVIVISEARKPSSKSGGWASDMGDVMGAARTTYSPDMIILLRDWPDDALIKRAGKDCDRANVETTAKAIRRQQAEQGYALSRLSIVKGRDGTQRGNVDMKFHFETNNFQEDNGP